VVVPFVVAPLAAVREARERRPGRRPGSQWRQRGEHAERGGSIVRTHRGRSIHASVGKQQNASGGGPWTGTECASQQVTTCQEVALQQGGVGRLRCHPSGLSLSHRPTRAPSPPNWRRTLSLEFANTTKSGAWPVSPWIAPIRVLQICRAHSGCTAATGSAGSAAPPPGRAWSSPARSRRSSRYLRIVTRMRRRERARVMSGWWGGPAAAAGVARRRVWQGGGCRKAAGVARHPGITPACRPAPRRPRGVRPG
jgi:hypothetical protein